MTEPETHVDARLLLMPRNWTLGIRWETWTVILPVGPDDDHGTGMTGTSLEVCLLPLVIRFTWTGEPVTADRYAGDDVHDPLWPEGGER